MSTMRHISAVLTAALIILTLSAAPLFAQDASKDAKQGEKAEKVDKAHEKKIDAKKTADKKAPAETEAKSDEKEDSEKKDEAKEPAKDAEKKDEADEKPSEEKKDDGDEAEEKAKPETLTLKPEALKIHVDLDGAFTASKMHSIVVKAEKFSSFKIEEVVDHGAEVSRGDLLLKFESEDIDRAIADRERELRLAEISLREAEIALEEAKAAEPIRVAQAEASKEYTDEDFARYFKIYSELNRQIAERNLESAKFSLEYAREELAQLEKMYEADELTEETEEIILTRQRRAVESAEYYMRRAELQHEEMLKFDLPRSEQARKWSARLDDFSFKSDQEKRPFQLEKSELALDKQRIDLERNVESLDELRSDRSLLEIKSPAAGVVYYGECKEGKFNGAALEAKLMPEKTLTSSDAVLMTIVQTRPLVVEATFAEKELHQIAPKLKAEIIPTAFPEMKLDAVVESIDTIPSPDGKFHITLRVETDDDAKAVMPGFTCKAKLKIYENEKALLVPEAAVETDGEGDDAKHFVYVPGKDDKPTRREVTIGRKEGGKVEILKGVAEGQKVFAKKPE